MPLPGPCIFPHRSNHRIVHLIQNYIVYSSFREVSSRLGLQVTYNDSHYDLSPNVINISICSVETELINSNFALILSDGKGKAYVYIREVER